MNDLHASCFDFAPRTRMVFGPGSLDRLGELTSEYGGRRILLVTDRGIVQAGHVERAIAALRRSRVEVVTFDRVVENPNSAVVDDCVEVARDAHVDFLIGLGGGSSMDTAKGCNFVLTGGGKMEDYWGVGKATAPMLPLIAVPTTTGTGSECQSYALISHAETGAKMACGDPKAAAKVALLDPQLAQSQPRHVVVCTGIDALAHAIESAVCNRKNPISALFSCEAFRLCVRSFPAVLNESDNLLAFGDMQLGAAWAGMAIEHSMLGAAHAMANPLTKRYGLVHGLAVGLMLPTVIRFNGEDQETEKFYRDMMQQAGQSLPDANTGSAADLLATQIEETVANAGVLALLGTVAIQERELDELACEAALQWTARFNPRPVSESDFRWLYRRALGDHGLIDPAPGRVSGKMRDKK